MKCAQYQKWLHLNRPGELSQNQQKKLMRHLSHCAFCAEEKHKIEKADHMIVSLRQSEPQIKGPTVQVNRILQKIERAERIDPSQPWIDSLLDWLTLSKVKLAIVAIVVFLIGSFFLQESIILHRICRLEERIANPSIKHSKIQNLSIPSMLSGINLTEVRPHVKQLESRYKDLGQDWILVKKNEYQHILDSNQELRVLNQVLLKELSRTYSLTEPRSDEDDLDALMEYLKKNRSMLRQLRHL